MGDLAVDVVAALAPSNVTAKWCQPAAEVAGVTITAGVASVGAERVPQTPTHQPLV